MADIALRFFKDMLVIASPVQEALRRQGIVDARDQALAVLLEPETIEDVYRLETVAGPQVLATPVADFAPARLTAIGMEGKGAELARAAVAIPRSFKPQHLFVEIGPCGLPLDPSSKTSLIENRDQYSRAADLFQTEEFDAFFLNGFTTVDDLKCALMGVRKMSDAPIFASVDVAADGALASGRGSLAEAVAVMAEFGAAVAGFATAAAPADAARLATEARGALASQGADLCLMVSFVVGERDGRQQGPTPENPYYAPDIVMDAAAAVRAEGVQFLRAAGDATPAYTGVLAAAVAGQDVAVQ